MSIAGTALVTSAAGIPHRRPGAQIPLGPGKCFLRLTALRILLVTYVGYLNTRSRPAPGRGTGDGTVGHCSEENTNYVRSNARKGNGAQKRESARSFQESP